MLEAQGVDPSFIGMTDEEREAKEKENWLTKALTKSGEKFLPYAQRTGYVVAGILVCLIGVMILAWSYREQIGKAVEAGTKVAAAGAVLV